MTQQQVDNWSIGVKLAIAICVFLVAQGAAGAWWLASWTTNFQASVKAVDVKIEEVQNAQVAAQERAASRQTDIEVRLEQVVTADRERSTSLDQRIRPLESQAAATNATLQAINTSLLQLGQDFRDLRKALEDGPK